ncbi:MAG: adenylate/guanylate cyclase domain-containing protein [Epsilonproteobacteria bacterium]|nr:MAG: adenylate/guanylate cyclase domain-containing protein [Campylobacterota bacterium]
MPRKDKILNDVQQLLEKDILNEVDRKVIKDFISFNEKESKRFETTRKQADNMGMQIAQNNDKLNDLSKKLAKYLSPQIYDMIFSGEKEVSISSSRKKLTIFFSDIVNFTATTEKLESEELTGLLNDYLTQMSDIALKYGATIDKYIGDAIVIFFGDPSTLGYKEDALQCLKMSLEMQERMKDIRAQYINDGIVDDFQIRMGINTGYCTVGNFGSNDRMDYTIIGGNVNLAARLESSAVHSEILISHETYSLIKENISTIKKDAIMVKGISHPVQTYQVEGLKDSQNSIFKKSILGLDIKLNKERIVNKKDALQALHKAIENLVNEE